MTAALIPFLQQYVGLAQRRPLELVSFDLPMLSGYPCLGTAIANLSMRYAAIHGIVIAWWYRAMKGSTIEQMHSNWRSGTSLTGALTAGRRTGLMALACIFSTLVIIDVSVFRPSIYGFEWLTVTGSPAATRLDRHLSADCKLS